jgi:hypothetical protein
MLQRSNTILIAASFTFLFILCSFTTLPFSSGESESSVMTIGSASGFAPLAAVKQQCIDCWSGYGIVSDEFGSVTGASASLTIPKVSCNKRTTASAFLVALDGDSPDDFALTSVIVNCSGGAPSWQAEWYNAADGSSGVAAWTPKTGDSVSLNVSEASGTVSFTITDNTQDKTTTGSGSDANMVLILATCFADMLTNKNTGNIYPQVNFGTVKFSVCTAKLNGTTKPIGGFGSSIELLKWITYNSNDTKPLNKIGRLVNKENFDVTFKAAGP